MKYRNTLLIGGILSLILIGAGCSYSSNVNGNKQGLPVTSTVGRQSPKVILLPNRPTSTATVTEQFSGKSNFDIKIKGFSFQSREISVRVGDTITWTNLDTVPHTVTADDASFDSGFISLDGKFSKTFDTEGIFNYHCTPHPSMLGTVIVRK